MNPLFRSSAAVTLSVPSSDDSAVVALDELLHEALRGSDSALHLAAYELRGRIIMDVWSILEPFGYEHAAEDIADDTLGLTRTCLSSASIGTRPTRFVFGTEDSCRVRRSGTTPRAAEASSVCSRGPTLPLRRQTAARTLTISTHLSAVRRPTRWERYRRRATLVGGIPTWQATSASGRSTGPRRSAIRVSIART